MTLRSSYRTSSHNLGKDFLAQFLAHSTRYHRAVGFFSSSVFSVAKKEHLGFFSRGGTVHIVCSEIFSAADGQALAAAVYDRTATRNVRRLDQT